MSTSNPKDPRPANTAHAADIRAKRRRERALPQTDWVLSDYEMLLFQENLPRQTMKFMELPLELRNMIYKEFLGQDFSIWNNTLTDDQAKLRIGGMTLLLLSKTINEEARRVLFRQNFSLTGQYAFFVMDSFLHTIGTDSIQHLRHITTTVPFVIYGTDFYRARSDRCGNELRRVYESIRNTCGFRIPRSSRGRSNENGYDVMVKSVRATCRRIAKSNVKKLDLLLPLDGFYITHTPAGYRYRWGKTTLISLIVHNLRETDQPRASACFWTELEELGKTKPELTISLILVHSSGQSWSQLRPHEVQYWRGQAEWVLCRGKSLGWKIGHATDLGNECKNLQVKYDPDIMEGKFGDQWTLPDSERPPKASTHQSIGTIASLPVASWFLDRPFIYGRARYCMERMEDLETDPGLPEIWLWALILVLCSFTWLLIAFSVGLVAEGALRVYRWMLPWAKKAGNWLRRRCTL